MPRLALRMHHPTPKSLFVLLALLATGLRSAQAQRNVSGGALIAEQACFDVRHYELRLQVDPAAKSIEGTLTMRATMVADAARLALDLDPALQVRSAQLDGAAVPFVHEKGRIWLSPSKPLAKGATITVAIAYGGVPRAARNPPSSGGFVWGQTKDGAPWIATCCQTEGGDLWWPCKDHPSDEADQIDLIVTVPKDLVVASNGTRHGEPVLQGELATYHWHSASPIANHSVALHIAPYVEIGAEYTCVDGTALRVQFFVLKQSESKARSRLQQFLDQLRGFEEILGPYPFRAEKYGVAEVPSPGMSHQTILSYGNGWQDDQYDAQHNRALAEEWWGNLLSCRDWRDLWLREGFATYLQAVFRERRFGRNSYERDLHWAQTRNLTALAPREVKTSAEMLFGGGGSDLAAKGRWVLHTLRWQLGDERFFQALREFCYPTEAARKATDGSQCRLVDTDEFVALCSRIAGEDLGWFFEVYVRQPQLPRLHQEKQNGVLRLRWETPQELPFALPVPVRVHGAEVRVAMPGGNGELQVGDADYVVDQEVRLLMVRERQRVR